MREEARGILGSEGKGVLLSFFFLLPPPPTNDPFIPIPIRTPLRGECWITPRKSVLDFLSRVTKQTLNRENSSCFSLFFGFCYSYTFILHVSTPFLFFRRKKERGLYIGRKFSNRFFYPLNSYLLPRREK